MIQDAGFDELVTLTDDKATFDRINELMVDVYPARLKASEKPAVRTSGGMISTR